LKPNTPRGAKVLRGISIAVMLIVILVVVSVVYSAYSEYNVAMNEFRGGQGVTSTTTRQGFSEIATVNITVPNKGLFPLNVTVACPPAQQGANAYCESGTVTVPPGLQHVLTFRVVVNDFNAFLGGTREINATVSINMQPFASVSFVVNLANYLRPVGP
jgi:hypothetical protein